MKSFWNEYYERLLWFVSKSCCFVIVQRFETFRKQSINSFKFDPACYLSTSGNSWDAMFWFSDFNLKLISDIEKYQFIKSTIRGGMSMIYNGYAEANKKFLKSYDANKRTSYIVHLAANKIYMDTLW